MFIMDMHTHTFPPKIAERALEKLSLASGTIPFTAGTREALSHSMQEAGIQYSVILPVATSADQVTKINDDVIARARSSSDQGILSFGAMHPDFEHPARELKRLRDAGIKGIKIHPAYTGTRFDDTRFLPILDAAAEYDLPVTTHAGIDIGIPDFDYCSTEMVLNVLSKLSGLKLILAHMGGWLCWDKVARDLAGAPLYFDTSFSVGSVTLRPDRDASSAPSLLSEEAFVSLCRHLGCDRILFGTDCPWSDQKTDIARMLSLPFTEEERRKILGENARALLKM